MLLLGKWWSPEACKACRANNGGCECERNKVCKCLEHEAARAAGVSNPFAIADPVLENFAVLVRNAILMSPLGVNGVPTMEGLAWFQIDTPYDTETTQNLAWLIWRDLGR